MCPYRGPLLLLGCLILSWDVSNASEKKHSDNNKRPGTKLEHHYEGIVVSWLRSVNSKELQGVPEADLAHKIVSHGGWACYATLIQLQNHMADLRHKQPEPFEFGIRDSIRDEVLRICGADEKTKVLPVRLSSTHGSGGVGGAQQGQGQQWVFNRQHNGLGNQVTTFLLLSLSYNETLPFKAVNVLFLFTFVLRSRLFIRCSSTLSAVFWRSPLADTGRRRCLSRREGSRHGPKLRYNKLTDH